MDQRDLYPTMTTVPAIQAPRDGQTDLATKTCIGCLKALPLERFYYHRTEQRYFSRCRRCIALRDAELPRLSRSASEQRTCVSCHGPIPRGRTGTTCCRPCLLTSIGLPVDFDVVRDLDRATEDEVRDTLNAVLLAARVKAEVRV